MNKTYLFKFALLALLGLQAPAMAVAAESNATAEAAQQARKITGTVVDESGEPVIGASVLVKGKGTGSVTDLNGKFTVEASTGAVLQISFVGYTTQEIKVTSASTYKVILKDDSQALNEVVVTAMGIKKERKALGYAVSDIKAEELMRNKSNNVVNSLAGKIAGVTVTQAGGAAGHLPGGDKRLRHAPYAA